MCVRILIHQLVYFHILISGISSSLPVDIGQKPNHVNLWCSFVCVFIYFQILDLLRSYCLFPGDLSIVIIFFIINIEVGVLSGGAFIQQTSIKA